MVVGGEALLELVPFGGEGVHEPGGDEVAFVDGASGWPAADRPGGGARFEAGDGFRCGWFSGGCWLLGSGTVGWVGAGWLTARRCSAWWLGAG